MINLDIPLRRNSVLSMSAIKRQFRILSRAAEYHGKATDLDE